jgi:hypothetical protein
MGKYRRPVNPWRKHVKADRRPRLSYVGEHSEPVEAMRDRDLCELRKWFVREDMSDLEQDINGRLSHLSPEPYWEEEAWVYLLSWA